MLRRLFRLLRQHRTGRWYKLVDLRIEAGALNGPSMIELHVTGCKLDYAACRLSSPTLRVLEVATHSHRRSSAASHPFKWLPALTQLTWEGAYLTGKWPQTSLAVACPHLQVSCLPSHRYDHQIFSALFYLPIGYFRQTWCRTDTEAYVMQALALPGYVGTEIEADRRLQTALGQLSGLTSLNLSKNAVTCLTPSLRHLRNLRSFELDMNCCQWWVLNQSDLLLMTAEANARHLADSRAIFLLQRNMTIFSHVNC